MINNDKINRWVSLRKYLRGVNISFDMKILFIFDLTT
jgi:hypothetical protein